jgi:hypothetical protein
MYVALLIVSVFVFGAITVYFAMHPAASWFHPLTTYLGFHGLVFVIRPWFSWFYEFEAIYKVYQFTPDDYTKNMALIVANVGLIAFAVASLQTGWRPFEKRWDAFNELERRELAQPLVAASIILFPIIAYSLYDKWVDRIAGDADIQLDLSTGVSTYVSGSGYIQAAQMIGVSLIPILMWLFRFKLWTFVPMLVFVFFRAGTGGRAPIINAMICLACLFLYDRARRWPDWRVLLASVLAIVLFIQVGQDRGLSVRDLFVQNEVSDIREQQEMAPMEGMDLGNLEMVEYLIHTVPRKTGTYEYFVDQLQIFTEPVPRALWKDKPIGQPIRFFNLFDYGFPIGMTRSMPGEGWTQLGLLGVAVWCGLWGIFLGWIYNAWIASRQSAIQTTAYFSLLCMLIIVYRDGLLLTLLRQGLFIMLPCALWFLFARLMSTPRADELRERAMGQLLRLRRQAALPASDGPARAESRNEAVASALVPRSRRHAAEAVLPRAWRKKEAPEQR